MNAASLVTSIRIGLSPLFFAIFTITVRNGEASSGAIVALWLLFAVMELSDFADGQVARRTGSVTPLGKVLDPFADSFARLTYFLTYVVAGLMPGWAFLIVLYRDLGVSFIRLMAMSKGIAMAAQVSGKIKAGVYAVAGGAGLALVSARSLLPGSPAAGILGWVMAASWWACAAVAAWSMVDYWAAYRRMAAGK
ncbi:MAG TPA: CDP-alcohol phosphatidyltransferase family protein [Spirochaetia bacterium]|nr:CDP-alcohol phosphatidyltransferase family protein [Spirochaetia bacterium]